jgi:hypothetical protein
VNQALSCTYALGLDLFEGRRPADVAGIGEPAAQDALYGSVFRFNAEMIPNTRVHGFPGAHASALHLRRLSAGDLFESCSESLETVWAGAKRATF